MNKLVLTASALAVLAWGVAARAEQVTLRVEGVHADADGDAITEALRQVPGAKVAQRVTREQPTAVVAFDPDKADVGDLAKAVAAAKTPNRDKGAPSAVLVLRYQRLDGNALADEAFLPKRVEEAVARLKGVDGKQWRLDFKKQELHLKLDDKGGAKLADIKKGFPGLMMQ